MEFIYVRQFHRMLPRQARLLREPRWIAQSLDFQNPLFMELIQRKNGDAEYGIYRLLCGVAAKICDPQGVFALRNGAPHTPQTLSQLIYRPPNRIAKGIAACLEVGLFLKSETIAAAVEHIEKMAAEDTSGKAVASGDPDSDDSIDDGSGATSAKARGAASATSTQTVQYNTTQKRNNKQQLGSEQGVETADPIRAIQALCKIGMKPPKASQLVRDFGPDGVARAFAALESQIAKGNRPKRPAGYIVGVLNRQRGAR